jgi:hypothetical protein
VFLLYTLLLTSTAPLSLPNTMPLTTPPSTSGSNALFRMKPGAGSPTTMRTMTSYLNTTPSARTAYITRKISRSPHSPLPLPLSSTSSTPAIHLLPVPYPSVPPYQSLPSLSPVPPSQYPVTQSHQYPVTPSPSQYPVTQSHLYPVPPSHPYPIPVNLYPVPVHPIFQPHPYPVTPPPHHPTTRPSSPAMFPFQL